MTARRHFPVRIQKPLNVDGIYLSHRQQWMRGCLGVAANLVTVVTLGHYIADWDTRYILATIRRNLREYRNDT